MLNVEPEQLKIVQEILQRYVPEHRVWAFGSRTTDKVKPYSDLDLAIISDEFLGFDVLADLNNAFSESDLPWKVDILDWSTISDNFKEIIKQHYVVLQ